MSSNSNSSSKKMKGAGRNYESNSNDIQFGANILHNASSCMFPDRFSQPNNAMIAPYSPPNFVSRLDQPQHRVNVDAGSYIDPYFRTLPPGIRFCPHDEELVVYYLMKKTRNEPLPRNRIHEVNIYEYHPKTLAEKYKLFREEAWYFFTPRVKKYPNGSVPDRGVPGGFWKPTGSSGTKIFDEHSNTVIERRSLDFYEGKGKTGRRTDWKMHEYYPATNNVSSTNTQGMRLNDCVLCRIYLKGGKEKAEAKTTCEKSRNDGNTASHGSADSRNYDHTSSANHNSQQPDNHGASASHTVESDFDETRAFSDYSMNQRCYADSRDQIVALMDPAMHALPTAIDGTSRGFSQRVAFAGPSSSAHYLTMNVAGMINGPSFSMPPTMHGAGLNQPNSSMPLTMHVAGLNGATSSMPLTMHVAGLNGATSSMHGAGLNGPTSSMHGAGLNGPSSSKPPTTLPGNTMDADDHLVELVSLPDSDFHDDDDIARILETFLQ